ncbi:MAG: hypothetical protein AcusKO_19880 [Acuticoccus sp.]
MRTVAPLLATLASALSICAALAQAPAPATDAVPAAPAESPAPANAGASAPTSAPPASAAATSAPATSGQAAPAATTAASRPAPHAPAPRAFAPPNNTNATAPAAANDETDGATPPPAVASTEPVPALAVGLIDDAPPFSTAERYGTRVGFDVDLAYAICARIERRCRFEALPRGALALGLRDRRLDLVIASDGRVDGLANHANFSDPYVVLAARFVVPKASSGDLEGSETKPYGAVAGTPFATYLQKTYAAPGAVRLYSESEPMWIDLALSRLAGALATAVTARTEFIATPLGGDFRFSASALTDSDVKAHEAAIAVRKGEANLLATVNDALAQYMASPDYPEALNRHLSGGLASRPVPNEGR